MRNIGAKEAESSHTNLWAGQESTRLTPFNLHSTGKNLTVLCLQGLGDVRLREAEGSDKGIPPGPHSSDFWSKCSE